MTTRTATLMVRYKAADGWKRAQAARGANGRIKPGYALIDGEAVKVSGFQYQVRYYVKRDVKFASAGTDANQAETLRRRIEHQASVKAEAVKAGVKVQDDEVRKTLAGSSAEYIKDAEQRNANEAAAQARNVTEEFIKLTRKTYLDEITRNDVLRFHAALRKRGCEDRTVSNKHARLKSWLIFAGIDRTILPPAPKYEEKLPTIYTSDEISSITGAADSYMNLAIGLALKCGLRDQEITFLEWADIDEAAQVVQVRGKDKYRFKVKDSEQREVPIPDDLLTDLKAWKEKQGSKGLVLPTKSGRPNDKLLRTLKRLAKSAKLNCGRCDGCKGPARECQDWTLHKFRRTYATTLLRSGFDLRTVQSYMGHADLASTMRYLRPAASSEMQAKLNTVKW
jgi:integrase